jgi:phospholipid-binding lipoprotein MlaA
LRPRHILVLAGLGAALFAGQVRAETPGDPFEKTNRRFYDAAMRANRTFFRPIAHLYGSLAPGPIGSAIHNFITNLGEPVVIANDILQFRLRRAGDDFARLVTNTTFGVGGLADLAVTQGLPHHENDFGVTLGRWGVGPGPYVFLPFIGPSTVRDALGMGADTALNPFTFVRFPGRLTLLFSTQAVGALDTQLRSEPELEAVTADAADPYATIRSDYLQSREALIRGDDAGPILPPLDDPAPAASSPATAPSAAIAPPPAILTPPPPLAIGAPAPLATDPDAAMATAQPCDLDGAASAKVAEGA